MQVAVLIDGYNEVVEELYEIPEVRKWTRELFDKFPHIIYFLEADVSECSRILMLNVSTIKATVYSGQEIKKPISEYSDEEMINGLPRTNVLADINTKLMARIIKKTLEFGASIGDIDGAIVATDKIESLFSYNPNI